MIKKIRVLQLQNYPDASTAAVAEEISNALPREVYEVDSVFLRGHQENSICLGCSQEELKGLRLRALLQLYKFIRQGKYDVVIAHRFKSMSMLMLLNIFLSISLCVGVLHGVGDFDRAYRRWQSRKLLRSNWRVVGVSRSVTDYLLGCNAGFNEDNTRLINNAIDIVLAERSQYSRQRARELLGMPSNIFLFGAIGRLVPVKGHIHLIEAFALLKDEYPEAQFAIIGGGRLHGELASAISQCGLSNRVHLLGAKENALQYVRAFDVFVMPSLSEGLPLALLEGMSGHLPVISSDIDSLKSVVKNCGGRTFPVGDSVALAQRMREVMDLTAEQRAAEGERVYAYLCHAYGIDGFRRSYRNLLEEALQETRRV